ncbi:MAG: hypothetical protein CMF22_11295 [Idiomarinaceae bacterium]|nr:hypothetical protein [Idiomarinaceae bacterium]|tara:strand:- start:125931 stop:126443 length:513 start_codon:yes stop_codon:yes gene_type:complete
MANIQNVRAVGDPQRAYEFEVEILGSATSGSLSLLKERVQSVNIPETAVEVIEINYKSRKTNHAGRDASGHTATVTFWDDEQHSIYSYFKNWMEVGISNSETGGGATRDLYAVDMIITQFGHDATTVTGTHRLTQVFPTSIGDIQLDYSDSSHQTVEVTFSFDSNLYSGA